MPHYIIGWSGHKSDVAVIVAADGIAAMEEAVRRSIACGGDGKDVDDTWAQPYDEGLAYDLGLYEPSPPNGHWLRTNGPH